MAEMVAVDELGGGGGGGSVEVEVEGSGEALPVAAEEAAEQAGWSSDAEGRRRIEAAGARETERTEE